nr:MAG TPA: hypothetical protein [Bacteriophage sp.]
MFYDHHIMQIGLCCLMFLMGMWRVFMKIE